MLISEALPASACLRPAPDRPVPGQSPAWLLPLTGATVAHGCLLVLLLTLLHPSPPRPLPEVVGVVLYAAGELPAMAPSAPAVDQATPARPRPVGRQSRNRQPVAPREAVRPEAVAIAETEIPAHPPKAPSALPQATTSQAGPSSQPSPEAAGKTAGAGGAGLAEPGPAGPEAVVVQARPRYRDNPPPPYPDPARRRQLEGTVVLEVEVSAQGRVGALAVHRSSGHRMLDESALAAVRGWLFEPGRRGGLPVAMTVQVPVRFGLR